MPIRKRRTPQRAGTGHMHHMLAAVLVVSAAMRVGAQCPSTSFSAAYTPVDMVHNLQTGKAVNPNPQSTRSIELLDDLLRVSGGTTGVDDDQFFYVERVGATTGPELVVDVRIELVRRTGDRAGDCDIGVLLSDGMTSVGMLSLDQGPLISASVAHSGQPGQYNGTLPLQQDFVHESFVVDHLHFRATWTRGGDPGVAILIQSIAPNGTAVALTEFNASVSLLPDAPIVLGLLADDAGESFDIKSLSIGVCGEDLSLGQVGSPAANLRPACQSPAAVDDAARNPSTDATLLHLEHDSGIIKFGDAGSFQDAFLCHGADQTLVVPSLVAHGDVAVAGDLTVQGANVKATLDFLLGRIRRLEDDLHRTGPLV